MFKILNNLKPFFEDCYSRISVRQYAKLMKIAPATASALLKNYEKEELLIREKYRNYMMFYANKNDKIFIGMSRLYWLNVLQDLVNFIESKTVNPAIVLFGSLSKSEVKPDSDIDLAIFTSSKKINLENFEKKLKRNIQVFWYTSLKSIGSEEIANSIINGYVLAGRLKL